jgi:glycosyltransferase involved in cell wall biosynthesis
MGADPSRTRVIANGVDTTVFHPRDRAAVRRKYGIDGPLILSAGHLIELKGHHRVVRALKGLHARGIRAKLLIAGGEGPAKSYRQEIMAQIETLCLTGDVRLAGECAQEEVAELMSAADVFCLASSSEGCPNVVSEALACCVPVVATDVGALPQLVPSENYGILAPVDAPDILEDALYRALTKRWDRSAIAAWGRRRGWEEVAAEVIEEFAAVAGVRSASSVAKTRP